MARHVGVHAAGPDGAIEPYAVEPALARVDAPVAALAALDRRSSAHRLRLSCPEPSG